MLSFLRKIKKLRFRKIGAKGAAIFLINRKLPALGGGQDHFGTLTDLRLDRPANTITLDVKRNEEVNSIAIQGYKIVLFKGKSCLQWEKIVCQGQDRKLYGKFFQDIKRIEIPGKYMTLLETVL